LEPRIEACLDAIRLAAWERQSTSQFGGEFAPTASEAWVQLWNSRSGFSVDQCKDIIQAVWQAEELREAFAASQERSRWLMQNRSWQTRLRSLQQDWLSLLWPPGMRSRADAVAQRVLLVELAIRAFEKEQGRLPNAAAELVPDYLPAVPQDPFSDGPLRYLKTESDYVLYSIGPNGVDDGGRIAEGERPWLRLDLPSSLVYPSPRTPPPAANQAPSSSNEKNVEVTN
jgi:hypothetical protein